MIQFRHGLRAAPLLPLVLALAACGGGGGDGAATTAPTAQLGAQVASETVLTPVGAAASSAERGDLSAAAAIDRNDGTRWGSGFGDNEYLTLDFGSSQLITRVRISWENAHASAYLLQVSDDNSNWSTIRSVENSGGGVEDITGLSGQGRYLRMQGVKRSGQYGYSFSLVYSL